ncbi:hypothetical protein [Pseudoalteromonas prydzensis]|uniref:hypothetical protein n=1 Tax=Pseudoalteromonas prydzensis TaxID=182141 RepID=UPI0024BCA9AC|nr:hypothetical protein [Pseudoalteromonas prydzensis]
MFIAVAIVQAIATGYLKKGYLPEKGKLKALTEGYHEIQKQLTANTRIVEGIKDDLAKKTWASQQVWELKKDAYDKIWINLLEMTDYVSERLAVDQKYYEIFINNCGYSGIDPEVYSEEIVKKYDKNAEDEIAIEKEKFNRKYNTEQYISEQKNMKMLYIENLKSSIKNIEINSIYLSPEIEQVSQFLKSLVDDQFKDNSYTWIISEQEGISEWEWYDHIIFEYEKLLEVLRKEMKNVKTLASVELNLDDHKVQSSN